MRILRIGLVATLLVYGLWTGHPPWAYLVPAGLGVLAFLAATGPWAPLRWKLLGGGQVLFFAGDVFYYGLNAPFPEKLGNLLYLAAYVPWVAGISLMVARSCKAPRWLADTVLAAAPLEALYILVVATTSSPARYEALVLWAFPLDDVLLLAGALWLLVTVRARKLRWLTGAIAVLFVTDWIYRGIEAHGTYQMGSLLDLGWIAYYFTMARAAQIAKAGRQRGNV